MASTELWLKVNLSQGFFFFFWFQHFVHTKANIALLKPKLYIHMTCEIWTHSEFCIQNTSAPWSHTNTCCSFMSTWQRPTSCRVRLTLIICNSMPVCKSCRNACWLFADEHQVYGSVCICVFRDGYLGPQLEVATCHVSVVRCHGSHRNKSLPLIWWRCMGGLLTPNDNITDKVPNFFMGPCCGAITRRGGWMHLWKTITLQDISVCTKASGSTCSALRYINRTELVAIIPVQGW